MNKDKQKFIGEFQEERYLIRKEYLDSKLNNVRLYHTKFTPSIVKASICIIHGFGEHSGRFYQIAHFFATHEYEVLLIDLTGFGYSGGPRGCSTLEILENDVITLITKAREDLPLFIYGHSMGGLAVVKLLLERPQIKISGCILTAPLLELPRDRKMSFMKIKIVSLLGDELEDLIVNSMINPTALTKNNKYMHNIFEDRLMIPFLGVKMAKSMIQSITQIQSKMHDFSLPVIVFHGKKDSVVHFESSRKFVYTKLTAYKQLHLFQNGYHELQHDEERDQLLERALRFIESLPRSGIVPLGKVMSNDLAIPHKPKGKPILKGVSILVILGILFYVLRRFKK